MGRAIGKDAVRVEILSRLMHRTQEASLVLWKGIIILGKNRIYLMNLQLESDIFFFLHINKILFSPEDLKYDIQHEHRFSGKN